MSIAWTLARLCGPLPTLHSRFLLGGKPKRTRQSNTIEVLTPYAVSINVTIGFQGPALPSSDEMRLEFAIAEPKKSDGLNLPA